MKNMVRILSILCVCFYSSLFAAQGEVDVRPRDNFLTNAAIDYDSFHSDMTDTSVDSAMDFVTAYGSVTDNNSVSVAETTSRPVSELVVYRLYQEANMYNLQDVALNQRKLDLKAKQEALDALSAEIRQDEINLEKDKLVFIERNNTEILKILNIGLLQEVQKIQASEHNPIEKVGSYFALLTSRLQMQKALGEPMRCVDNIAELQVELISAQNALACSPNEATVDRYAKAVGELAFAQAMLGKL